MFHVHDCFIYRRQSRPAGLPRVRSTNPGGETDMLKNTLFSAAILASALFAASSVRAEDTGSAAEAKAMLDRAIVEVKADLPAAIVKFNDPKGNFRDRDLYVFCANISDGKLTAHPKLVGTDIRTIKDKN